MARNWKDKMTARNQLPSVALAAAVCSVGLASLATADVSVGDAYARSEAGGRRWTVGTKAVRMVLDGSGGALRLVSFQNRLVQPPLEYADPASAAAPLGLAERRWTERFAVEVVWTKPMVGNV